MVAYADDVIGGRNTGRVVAVKRGVGGGVSYGCERRGLRRGQRPCVDLDGLSGLRRGEGEGGEEGEEKDG